MTQYSKRMVIVHWLTLILLVAAWFLGESVHDLRKAEGATLTGYTAHALVGGAVLLLTVMRLLFRSTDSVPAAAANTAQDSMS